MCGRGRGPGGAGTRGVALGDRRTGCPGAAGRAGGGHPGPGAGARGMFRPQGCRSCVGRSPQTLSGWSGPPWTPTRWWSRPGAGPCCLTPCFLEAGDEALVPDPGFPIYATAVRLAGGIPVALPLRPEHGSCLRAADVGCAQRGAGVRRGTAGGPRCACAVPGRRSECVARAGLLGAAGCALCLGGCARYGDLPGELADRLLQQAGGGRPVRHVPRCGRGWLPAPVRGAADPGCG